MLVTRRNVASLAVGMGIGLALVVWQASYVPRPMSCPGRAATTPASAPSADRTVANLTRIAATVALYRADRNDAYPASLDAAFRFADFLTADDVRQLTTDPVTGRCPGYAYVKPVASMADPARTPMVYELRDGSPDADGAIAYADGHVEPARARR